MSHKIKVIINFKNYTEAKFEQFGQFVLACMTGNLHFLTPVPDMVELKAAVDAYVDALSKSAGGGKENTILKNQARQMLEDVLCREGMYVEANGKNDEAIIGSTGFDIKKTGVHAGVLPAPADFKIVAGPEKGVMHISFKGVDGSNIYAYEYAMLPYTPDTVWIHFHDRKTNYSLYNLQSGKEYAFRVTAVSNHPENATSNILTSFVV